MGNILLLLVESTMGQLTFPKCYLSSPLFVTGLFVAIAYVNHEVFFEDWPYEQPTFRWTTIFYLNGFFGMVFGTHFSSTGSSLWVTDDMEASEAVGRAHAPVHAATRPRPRVRTRRRDAGVNRGAGGQRSGGEDRRSRTRQSANHQRAPAILHIAKSIRHEPHGRRRARRL